MKKIKEVLVVEGKDDTKRIKMAVNADTLETRGSAIGDETIEQIAQLQESRGVIVFTDPDFSGEKIRNIITREVPGVKHAFLNKKDAAPSAKGSLGVEHASVAVIREALANLYTEVPDSEPLITREDLWDLGLLAGPTAKKKRALLGETLKIGYTNGKQLYNRLNLFQITPEQLKSALDEMENGQNEE